MLYVQWKAARWLLAPCVLLGFGLPLLELGTARRFALDGYQVSPGDLIAFEESTLLIYPLLAGVTGCLVALAAWQWDHRVGHVYALSLPVSRARYVLLRFAAGAVLLLIPVAALWLGALAAVTAMPIPAPLHAYTFAFGVRFLVACLIAYAVVFALAAGTIRTTVVLVSAWLVFLIFGSIAVDVIERATHATGWFRPIDVLEYVLVRWAGPFQVFGGSWMLIDV
jgi:hypothetical protein